QAGDQLLTEAARRMREALRATDLVGRVGGDEFVVLAPGPYEDGAYGAAALALQHRLSSATRGMYAIGDKGLNYGGASAGVVAVDPIDSDAEEAIRLADAQMYRVKQGRK
ncbi:MAG TPA: GGDEF domain-containing protein, partial [Rhizobacter sp.]|nr:GGDEF domain-containing protein [Rhizobacter sp.]